MRDKKGSISLMGIVIFAVLILLIGGIVAAISCQNVPGQHTNVCIKAWNQGDIWTTVGPGLHLNPAYMTMSFVTVNNQVRTEEFIGSDAGDDNAGSIAVRSSDNLEIYMDFSISYQIPAENSAKVLQTYGLNYLDQTVTQFGRSVPRDVAAKYTALDIIGEMRGTVEHEIRIGLEEKFNGTGINIVNFSMRDIRPPQSVSDAIESKKVAEQQMIAANYTAQAAIVAAEGQNKVVLLQANASAMSKILNAQGEAEAISLVTEMLKEQYGDASGELYAQYLFMQALNNPDSPIQYYLVPSDGSTPVILNTSG